jgi:hypothetical protein
MTNNVFRFGDTHLLQLSGMAMGTPPYATLFFAIYEEIILQEFKENLLVYRRFLLMMCLVYGLTHWVTKTAFSHSPCK